MSTNQTPPDKAPAQRPGRPQPAARSGLRAVALPTEHGGWGLTVEPGLLGLLVEPSIAGACLAFAALLAFLIRTPLKLALIDRRRGRRLPRTKLAEKVTVVEGVLLIALAVTAVVLAKGSAWLVPLLIAIPLVAIEMSYDIKSHGRRLIPELAGAIAITSTVAAIVLAGSDKTALAYGLWLVLAARAISSIPHVRTQIARAFDRPRARHLNTIVDTAALVMGIVAVVLDQAMIAGAVGLAAILGYQAFRRQRPVAPIKVVGMTQMVFGFGLVIITAIGVAINS